MKDIEFLNRTMKMLNPFESGRIILPNGKIAFPSTFDKRFIGEGQLEKIIKINQLRESCGVHDKGNTLKFRRYGNNITT